MYLRSMENKYLNLTVKNILFNTTFLKRKEISDELTGENIDKIKKISDKLIWLIILRERRTPVVLLVLKLR